MSEFPDVDVLCGDLDDKLQSLTDELYKRGMLTQPHTESVAKCALATGIQTMWNNLDEPEELHRPTVTYERLRKLRRLCDAAKAAGKGEPEIGNMIDSCLEVGIVVLEQRLGLPEAI
jgi:hypothetical protein